MKPGRSRSCSLSRECEKPPVMQFPRAGTACHPGQAGPAERGRSGPEAALAHKLAPWVQRLCRPAQGQMLTYAQLDAQANQLAHHLRSRGVQPGSCVGLLMERSTSLMVAILATLKAGAAYMPMDPEYPAERLALMAEDSEVRPEPAQRQCCAVQGLAAWSPLLPGAVCCMLAQGVLA